MSKEELSKIVTVKAKSEEEAINIIEDRYRNEEIILDYEDCAGYDIEVLKSDVNEE